MIDSGSGSDTIDGGEGNDIIIGGGGKDVIDVGAGVSILTAGNGDDSFVLRFHEIISGSGEYDVVTDFVTSEILNISAIAGPGGTVISFLPFSDGSRLYNFFAPMDTIVRWEH